MVSEGHEWQPTASIENLKARARILAGIRAFFLERDVMEVETPILSQAGSTAPYLDSFSSRYHGPGARHGRTCYLQTSPEFAMKRLLAAGSGPIYQICKAFRNGELGAHHNPEFTLLEWYRPGFDHHALMDEVEALLRTVLSVDKIVRTTYAELFQHHVGLDPHYCHVDDLRQSMRRSGIEPPDLAESDRDSWLSLVLTHLIEPKMAEQGPVFVYDFPASQAMLARVIDGEPALAQRFELYVGGVELANGFYELGDGAEQRRRFEADIHQRDEMALPAIPLDEHLITALDHGFPDCAGVALGIDRLVALALAADTLDQVIAFPFERA